MKKKQSRFEKNTIMILSIVTNLFIIAGVSRHWSKYHEHNTELAETQQQATQVQEKASYDTGCTQTH